MATSTAVKFYSVSTLPSSLTNGGIYFVQGGELYKEAQRFGLARVTDISSLNNDEIEDSENLQNRINALAPNAARGDLAYGYGAAKVFNGSEWVDLGADSTITDDLTSRVEAIESHVIVNQNLISATTGSFTNLTATTLNATSSMTVGNKTIEQIADSRIAAISSATVTASNNGIEVGVTTSGGSVTNVTVNAAAFANVVNFGGVITSGALPATPKRGDIVVIGTPDTEAELAQGLLPGQEYIYTGDTVDNDHPYDSEKWQLIGDQTATQSQIDSAIASALTYSASQGVTSSATTLKSAVEALASAVDGAKTEISSADTENSNLVTTGAVVDYVGDQLETLNLGTAASLDFVSTLGAVGGENLPTETAVVEYVGTAIAAARWSVTATAYPLGNETANYPTITVAVDESALDAGDKLTISATNFGTAVGANVVTLAQGETLADKSSSSDLPTASQVVEFVTSKIGSITASSIPVGTPGEELEWDGPLASLTSEGTVLNALAILNEAISDVSSTLTEVSAATVPFAAEQGYSGTILSSIDAASSATIYSAIEALDVAITTLSQSLGSAAYKGVATSIGPSTAIPAQGAEPSIPAASNDNLATEKAVRNAIEAAQMVWYDDDDVTP